MMRFSLGEIPVLRIFDPRLDICADSLSVEAGWGYAFRATGHSVYGLW